MCRSQKSILDPIDQFVSTQDLPTVYKTVVPDAGTSFGFGSIIRFKFPAQGLADLSSLALFFNVQLRTSGNGGRNLVVPNDIGSLFDTCRLVHGRTTVIDEIQHFGFLQSIFADIEEPFDTYVGSNGALMGVGSEQQLGTGTANTVTNRCWNRLNYLNINNVSITSPGWAVKRYMVRPRVGFFQAQKPLPLQFLGEQLYLEFRIKDTFKQCFYCLNNLLGGSAFEANAITLDIGRPLLKYRIDTPNPILNTKIDKALRSGTLQYQWEGIFHQRTGLNIFNAAHTIPIQCNKKRIKRVIAVIRCEIDSVLFNLGQNPHSVYSCLDPRDMTGTANIVDNVRRTSLRSYQWVHNNRMYPENPVEVIQNYSDNTAIPVTMTSMGLTSTTTLSSSAVEAYYNFYETFKDRDQFNPGLNIAKDGAWSYYDLGVTTAVGPVLGNTATSTFTASNSLGGTFPTKLIMTARFTFENGSGVSYALDGKSANMPLQLLLNFNGSANVNDTSTTQGGPHPMFVDTFVFYDKVWTLQQNGIGRIDE